MKSKNLIILGILVSSFLIFSMNIVPTLVSSDESGDARYNLGEVMKVSSFNNYSALFDNLFEVRELENNSIIHMNLNANSHLWETTGLIELLSLSQNYNSLFEAELPVIEGYDVTIFVMNGEATGFGESQLNSSEFQIGRVDEFNNGWENSTETHTEPGFNEQMNEFFPAFHNETYGLLFEEMFENKKSDYFDVHEIGLFKELNLNLNTEISLIAGKSFLIDGEEQILNVTRVDMFGSNQTDITFQFQIKFGDQYDDTAPYVDMYANVSLSSSFNSIFEFDANTGQFLGFERSESKNIEIQFGNPFIQIEIYDEFDEFQGYFNVSAYGEFAILENEYEYAKLTGFDYLGDSEGVGPLIKGDELFFTSNTSGEVNVLETNKQSDSNDVYFRSDNGTVTSNGNLTVHVLGDDNSGFNALIYGIQDQTFEWKYVEGVNSTSYFEDFRTETSPRIFGGFNRNSPYGDARHVEWNFDPTKHFNLEEIGLHQELLKYIPELYDPINMTEFIQTEDSETFIINGLEFHLTGDILTATYSKNISNSFILTNENDLFYYIPYISEELLVAYDISITIIEVVAFDQVTGSLVYIGDKVMIDINIYITANNSGEINLNESVEDGYYSLEISVAHQSEQKLSGSTVDYLTPQTIPETTSEPTNETTSEPANDTTSEPANDTTSEPANETTSESTNETTSEPTNETTSEPANDTTAPTELQTPINPLFAIEFYLIGLSISSLGLLLKRKRVS
jgi:hypothetical protein